MDMGVGIWQKIIYATNKIYKSKTNQDKAYVEPLLLHPREYWMIYRRPCCFAVVCLAPRPPHPPPHPPRSSSVSIARPAAHRKTEKERQLADDRERAWSWIIRPQERLVLKIIFYTLCYIPYKKNVTHDPLYNFQIGHFTQLAWNASHKVGCGFSRNRHLPTLSPTRIMHIPPMRMQSDSVQL
jgi:hypothetical protein